MTHAKALAAAEETVAAALQELDWPALPLDRRPRQGDLAVICFPAAKQLRQLPEALATELAAALAGRGLRATADGGYCNITLDWRPLAAPLLAEISAGDFGTRTPTGRRVLIEHTSANATGPFHMGRARNPIIGDTLARLLRYAGDEVATEYYVNDMGRQAATLAYGLRHFAPGDAPKVDHALVECYRQANAALEEDPAAKEAIYALMERCEEGDAEAADEVAGAAEKMLAGMRESLARLGAEADAYFHESVLVAGGAVNDVIERLAQSALCGDDDGAKFLDLAGHGIAGRNQRFFFTRKSGLSLYTTRDVAYHLNKFDRCDMALNVLGEDHKLQSQLLGIALGELDAPVPEAVFYAFVNLPGGKMSTRAGRVVYLDDMLDEAQQRALAELEQRRPDMASAQRQALATAIGTGALRYNILRVQAEKGFTFRWQDALSFEGDSAPFTMYSHARCCAILRRADGTPSGDPPSELHPTEEALLRQLARWPATIARAADERKLHLLPSCAHGLAGALNGFYRDCPVIGSDAEGFRLALVDATRRVLADVLGLLGVVAPEEM
ncbi:MAG: arginine--tRNA ligase [Gemmatimonadetes bacterium]|nr:arginine--tRNA ligase [Gemmatimonadota bacterium]